MLVRIEKQEELVNQGIIRNGNFFIVTVNQNTKARFLLIGKLLLMFVFAVSYRQSPLYSSNQNAYFLHGLAGSGTGFLNQDWLARTADPFPVFSTLVNVTVQILSENVFYFYYVVILAVYVYSLVGIACHIFDIGKSSIKYLSYFALFSVLYSGLSVSLLSKLSGLLYSAHVINPNELLTWGVALQYILGPIFQPSVFGVFIITSIYAFLCDRPFVAVFCLAISATFHPTYLLSAGVLTCSYMIVTFVKERNIRKLLLTGALAFVLVIPIIAYIYIHFRPTTSDIAGQAQSILADYRIPHHAQPVNWFKSSDISTSFKIVMVILAIYLVRRTKLFLVLLLPFIAAMILTVAQVITGNKALALLFPWRMSVFLVPIASSIILAGVVTLVFRIFSRPISKIARPLQAVILTVITIIGCLGVCDTVKLLNTPRVGFTASAKFAASTFQPSDLYLIPPDIQSFRLAARVPVLVDFKSHPYKDTEVIEWFNRLEIANRFYAAEEDAACRILEDISGEFLLTHVVLKSDSSISDCRILHELYRDADFVIYEVRNR